MGVLPVAFFSLFAWMFAPRAPDLLGERRNGASEDAPCHAPPMSRFGQSEGRGSCGPQKVGARRAYPDNATTVTVRRMIAASHAIA